MSVFIGMTDFFGKAASLKAFAVCEIFCSFAPDFANRNICRCLMRGWQKQVWQGLVRTATTS